jgi:flagellar motor switch protein FliN/FliY
MATDNVDLPDLAQDAGGAGTAALLNTDAPAEATPKHSAADLEAVFDVPVTVSAVLG